MSFKVAIEESFGSIHRQQWDDLISHCQASVFYSSDFLQAFECWPLHAVEQCFYLLGLSDDDQLQFAFPAYLQRGVDPMRVLADHFPTHLSDLVLLSHVWHCYDTCLPARELSPEVLCEVLEVLRQRATDVGARLFGFVNVEANGPFAHMLDKAGIAGIDIDRRFVMNISSFSSIESYLDTLPSKERSNFRRYLLRSQEAGASMLIHPPAQGDLDGFVTLARWRREVSQCQLLSARYLPKLCASAWISGTTVRASLRNTIASRCSHYAVRPVPYSFLGLWTRLYCYPNG